MRRLTLSLVVCLLPSIVSAFTAALAGPPEGYFENDKGSILHITPTGPGAFDFTLTAGGPAGAPKCPQGATDCLQIEGHASASGKGYVYIDPNDDRSRVFFAEGADPGLKVLSTTGNLGTGSANRLQMLALTGDYTATIAKETGGTTAKTSDTGTDDLHFFQSPTGNIACLFDVGTTTSVRCDLAQLNRSFMTPPKDCDLDWGDSFEVATGDKRGGLACHGDTVINPKALRLDYGSTLSFGDISCVSAKNGITCKTGQGHGFTVSRKMQSLF